MMKIKYSVLFLLILVSTSLCAQLKTGEYNPPIQQQLMIGDITLIKNLRYGTIPEIALDSTSDRILDLYLPKTNHSKDQLPVFFFIHGGGFTGGDKGLTDLCSKIANQGFAVVSINYRLTLKYKKVSGASCSGNMAKGLPADGKFHPVLNEAISNASEDAVKALKWVKDNASKYHLNINKVAISGGSAGGMTALHVAYASKQNVLPIKAVVNLWGGLENAEIIQKNSPPILTYHGDLDNTINVAYAYAISERMHSLKSEKSQLQILQGKGHAQYNLIAKEKVNEIIAFLNSVL